MSNAKAKTIELLLEDGTLNGVISMADSSWNAGELYSAPRESVDSLLKTDAVSKYGVYLLISEDMVYVGQASDLKKRIQQHKVGKDWWERVIILTTSDDSFNKSAIDYLEFVLIQKAMHNNKLECDNKSKGNPPRVSKFNKVSLDQYLDEALFLLELIGISVFSDNQKANKKEQNKTLIPSVKNVDDSSREIRAKGEAKKYLLEYGIQLSKTWTYASRQANKNYFWANPHVEYVEEEWSIVLNNQFEMELIVLNIPANTFEVDKNIKGKAFRPRADKALIDMQINADTFIDQVSKVDLSNFIVKRIKY